MILSVKAAQAIPPQGIVLIIAFAIIIIWAMIHDKKKKDGFMSDIQKKYKDKILEQAYNGFVTSDGEFFLEHNAGTVGGYKVFKLSDVGYVFSGRDMATRSWCFCILDSNKKAMKGEYLFSSKKVPLVEKNAVNFFVGQDAADAYCELIMKHAPHVQRFVRK